MKTIISMLGGPGGVYNLWKELTTTSNDIEVVYFDFTESETVHDGAWNNPGVKVAVERVCNLLKSKTRDFTFTILNKDNWTAEPFHGMELAYYAIDEFKADRANKLIFHFLKDEESEYTIQIVNGMKYRLNELSPDKGEFVFPGIENELSKLHVIRELPAYIRPYLVACNNLSEDGEACGVCTKCVHHRLDMNDLASNVSSEDFLAKKLNLLGRGDSPFEGTVLVGSLGNFEVNDHPIYGSFSGPRVPTNFPFSAVPDKTIFIS